VPDEDGRPLTFEFVPPSLYWYRYTQTYGFPNAGGWLDQPLLFMRDIEAARKGYAKRERERKQEADQLIPKLLVKILEAL